MTKCIECGEGLFSHAGRGWKFFHRHVLDGPYPNSEPHKCSLVNMAFESDGSFIKESDEARIALVEAIHGHKVKK